MGDGGSGRAGWPPTGQRYQAAFAVQRQSLAFLRNQLAATAERLAATFEHGARVREQIAECGGPRAAEFRRAAAHDRAVADFERRQAEALRAGRVLAVPWGRRAGDTRRRGRPPTGPGATR